MEKIAIVIAPRIQDDFGYTPAGASLVKASIVEAGYQCKIFDFNAELEKTFEQKREQLVPIDNWFLNHNFYSEKIFNQIYNLADEWAEQVIKYLSLIHI